VPYIDFQKLKAEISIIRAAQLLNLELAPSGKQLRGRCPACQSNDDHALAITPEKNAYYCHAGSVGGDCISLVAHVLGVDTGIASASPPRRCGVPSKQAWLPLWRPSVQLDASGSLVGRAARSKLPLEERGFLLP
jgi:hypothetical protein